MSCGYSAAVWSWTPIRFLIDRGVALDIEPEDARSRRASGGWRPSIISIVVVLPAPFGTEEAEDLALSNVERHAVDGLDGAVGLSDVIDGDDGVG